MGDKVKIDGMGEVDWKVGEYGRKVDERLKELRPGDQAILESAEGQRAKAEREKEILKTLGIKPEEKKEEKGLLENLKGELSDLEEKMKADKVTYFPLQEFRKRFDSLDTVSLKESAGAEDRLVADFEQIKKAALAYADHIRANWTNRR